MARKYARSHAVSVCRFLVACAFGGFSLSAFSQALPKWSPDNGYTWSSNGNTVTAKGPAANAGSLPFPGASNSGTYSVSGSPGGAVVNGAKNITVGGRNIGVNAVKTIPWKNVAIGVASVVRVSPQAIIGTAAAAWLFDNGYDIAVCAAGGVCDGAAQWMRKDVPVSYQTGSPNHDYRSEINGYGAWHPTVGMAVADMKAFVDSHQGVGPNYGKWRDWRCIVANCWQIQVDMRSDNGIASGAQKWVSDAPTYYVGIRAKALPIPDSWVPSGPPDFENDPPSAPDPGAAPDIWDDALPGGIPDGPGAPDVSGPAVVPGASSQETGPGGVTVTNNEYHLTYSGDTITINNVQNTTHTAPNGEVTTSQKTDEAQPEKDKEPEKDPCEKRPDSLGCVDLGDPPEVDIPRETKNITFQAEDVFGGGQCPANVQATFATIGKSATIVDWQTFCSHALPLRALVIGLASIMAMFIIMPGGKVE